MKAQGTLSHSLNFLKRFKPFWTSGENTPFEAVSQRSHLRVAALLSEERALELQPECELLLLTPENAVQIVKYASPDFILIESGWESATGEWRMALMPDSEHQKTLHKILEYAKHKGLPSVFWITSKANQLPYYTDALESFSHIITHSAEVSTKLREQNRTVTLLPDCFQPLRTHPFRTLSTYHKKHADILLSEDIDAPKAVENIFEGDKLSLRILSDQNAEHKTLLRCIRAITSPQKNILLRQSDLLIHNAVPSRTQLLATASACPALPLEQSKEQSTQQLKNDIARQQIDPLFLRQKAHKAWRAAMNSASAGHWLKACAASLGCSSDWNEEPRVTLVASVASEEQKQQILTAYSKQSYANKELLLFVEKQATTTTDVPSHIRILPKPEPYAPHLSIELAAHLGTGEYVLFLHEGLNYGKHFLEDILLSFRCAGDAQFVVKEPVRDLNEERLPCLKIKGKHLGHRALASRELLFALRKSVLLTNSFSSLSASCTITEALKETLIQQCAHSQGLFADSFNLVDSRHVSRPSDSLLLNCSFEV